MKASELRVHLKQSESKILDFKRDQYPLATDEQKGELLKDILAIANACHESDGHIVIGVDEKNGKATDVCGATPLGDANVQQLAKAKTNRPISFLVETVNYLKRTLSVIKIAKDQERPLFLRNNFGRLKGNVVYVRRGSSTVELTPDELIDMGRREILGDEQRVKKEKAKRFWRDFRHDLPRFANTACNFRYTANGRYFDALAEHALPAGEISEYLQQARELDMEKDFVDMLVRLAAKAKKLEECRRQGTAAFEEIFPNLRSEIEDVENLLRDMNQKYSTR